MVRISRIQRILKKCVKVYGFLQVYGKNTSGKGEYKPAKGPDSWVGDTLSGTVGIDGDTDPKKSDRFHV